MAVSNPFSLVIHLIFACVSSGTTTTPCPSQVPHDAVVREAIIQTLNGELLVSHSATMTLETWCADHELASPAKIIAIQLENRSITPPVPPSARSLLKLTPNDTVKYRIVELRCGDKVLSVADNWYVANRLTRKMNEDLERTRSPFGKVVSSLQPFRQTYRVVFPGKPLPVGWEMRCNVSNSEISPNGTFFILEHEAVVLTKDVLPIAFVHERYTKSMIDFL